MFQHKTSCARGDAICHRPCKLTISSHLFRHVGYLRHKQQVDLWPIDLESGFRVTRDVGYLCVNFSLPRPLRSRVRPDVRDRQTDVRHPTKPSLNDSVLWGRRHNNFKYTNMSLVWNSSLALSARRCIVTGSCRPFQRSAQLYCDIERKYRRYVLVGLCSGELDRVSRLFTCVICKHRHWLKSIKTPSCLLLFN